MSNKSYKIQNISGSTSDKYIKIKLEQDIDQLEILSLKISQKDIYASFNSDWGILVGRVIGNGSVGIPNARVSIFIPITDEDKLNSDILSIYPYSTPRDKNIDGVRYNLLPRVGESNPFISTGEYSPKVPLGTFPTKEEISTNQTYIEVFEKYYKYSTVTNSSGDYMLYGIPQGNWTAHMSVDLTDIGKFSMSPATMVNQLGYSPVLFDNGGTKVKFTTDLDTAPNIETQEIVVDIKPFWGDSSNFDIGITRQDFKIRALLTTSFTIFGASFTNAPRETRYNKDGTSGYAALHKAGETGFSAEDISIATKKSGNINVNVVRLKSDVDESKIGVLSNYGIYSGGTFDTSSDYELLDPSQYTLKTENGNFVLIIPCNRKKIITNNAGQDEEVAFDNPNGVFTEFRGFITFEMTQDPNVQVSGSFNSQRVKFKIPQNADLRDIVNGSPLPTSSFTDESTGVNTNSENWRKQHYKFQANKIYTVSKFHGMSFSTETNGFNFGSGIVQYNLISPTFDNFQNVGILFTDDTIISGNSLTQFPYNYTNGTGGPTFFGIEWLNFCLWFDVYGWANGDQGFPKVNGNLTYNWTNFYYLNDVNNKQLIGGKLKGTLFYQRSDQHRATFTEVPIVDINIIDNAINNLNLPKGFYDNSPELASTPLTGNYPSTSIRKYFYRGLQLADCIEYLKQLGLV